MIEHESKLRQSWLQMSSIQIGGAICLPILMVGQMLGATYGIASALAAIILGNTLLFALGIIKAKMSFENRQITIENASNYFGSVGKKLLALNMIISLIGWFAIQLNLISLSVQEGVQLMDLQLGMNLTGINIILGLLITLGALAGIAGLEKLSTLSMPILLIVMINGLRNAFLYGPIEMHAGAFTIKGVSLVIATALLAIIDIPTYYRFSRSLKDSIISVFFSFAVALPLIEAVGVILATASNGSDIIATLTAHGSFTYQLFVLAFLVLAGWTTNNGNIYSAAVTLKEISRLSLPHATLLVGAIGILLSCFDVLSHFEVILNAMGILTSAMGAVIATCYLLKKFQPQLNILVTGNSIAWFLGVVIGFLGMAGIIHITGFEIIDAFITTMTLTIFFAFVWRKQ